MRATGKLSPVSGDNPIGDPEDDCLDRMDSTKAGCVSNGNDVKDLLSHYCGSHRYLFGKKYSSTILFCAIDFKVIIEMSVTYSTMPNSCREGIWKIL